MGNGFGFCFLSGVYPIDACTGSLAFEVGLPVLILLDALL